MKPQVQIDGVDTKEINVKHLRKHIGVVSQEPILFDASIKKNILMGHPEATEEMVIKAAKNANAHDFIEELPNVSFVFCVTLIALFFYHPKSLGNKSILLIRVTIPMWVKEEHNSVVVKNKGLLSLEP